MPNIGPLELIVVLIIALVVLGPKKLPDMGRSVGRGMREFKDAISGENSDDLPHELPQMARQELDRERERERGAA